MPKSDKITFMGRPPIYKEPSEMVEKIEDFINNPPTRQVYAGDEVIEVPCYTITGLAYHLGFESRQSFYDYEKKGEFSYIIKKARLFIENQYEQNLHAPQCTGSIFALKNMGWDDKREIDTPAEGITFRLIDATAQDAD